MDVKILNKILANPTIYRLGQKVGLYLLVCETQTLFFFKNLFIYLFREREGEGEGEGEKLRCAREIQIGYLAHTPARDQALNPGVCPDPGSNW